jgi:hypothetical protein
MKLKLIGAVAALSVLAASTSARAEGELTYDELATCAAFVLLEGQAYDNDKGSAEDKAKSENYYSQAAALTVAAALLSKRDQKVVTEDVKKRNSDMIASLSQDGAVERLMNAHASRCNALGEAAQEALSK